MTIFSKTLKANPASKVKIYEEVPVPSPVHWLAVGVAVMAGIILRVICFQGYSDSDPGNYTYMADQLAQGKLHIGEYDPVLFAVRFAIYVPTGFMFKLFGVSELTIAAVPFFFSVGSFFLAYVIARRLFNPLAGLVSIAILAVIPFDIAMATTLWPDAIAAGWANLGVALLIFDCTSERRPPFPILPVLAGLCFGVSWLGKEIVVYLAPFVAIFYFLQARQQRLLFASSHLLLVGLGVLSVVVAEAILYRIYRGDWLFHFHAIEVTYAETPVWYFDQSSPIFGWSEGGYTKALLKRLLITGPTALLSAFSMLPLFALVAIAWAAFTRDRRFIIPAVWLVTLMAMFNFSSSSLESYKPIPLWGRYLYPVLLPSTLLVSGALATLWQSKAVKELIAERRFWAAVWVLAYLLSCARVAGQLNSRPEQIVRDVLPKLDKSNVVYTDFRTASVLVFLRTGKLSSSNSTTVPYENVPLDTLKPGSLVFINQDKLDFLTLSYGYKIPELVSHPPKTWEHIWGEKRSALFRVE